MSQRPWMQTRPFAAVTIAALVAVVLVVAAVGAARSEPPAGSGSAVPITYGLAEPAGALPGAQTSEDIAAWSRIRGDIVGSGACWLRSDVDQWLTRAIQAFTWLGSPARCTASAGSPIKILGILDQQTVWAARRLCPYVTFSSAYQIHHSDFTIDDWRQLVRCVAGRFAGRISAYEIWNEPLLPDSMMGYEDGSAAHYVNLLRVADAEIKTADPNTTVIALGGSDVYAGGDQARLDQMRSFTRDLIALGAPRYADAISLHAYPWSHDDSSVWTSYLAELAFHEQAWDKPVWITEVGTRATDAGTQSEYVQAAYPLFLRAGASHIFWFSITDQPDGTFGLRGRPVESALRSFALSHTLDDAPPAGGTAAP